VYQANWDRLGRKAGPLRNAHIVANADRVVAFWDGKSRGTLNTVVQADRAGLPIEVFDGSRCRAIDGREACISSVSRQQSQLRRRENNDEACGGSYCWLDCAGGARCKEAAADWNSDGAFRLIVGWRSRSVAVSSSSAVPDALRSVFR
jgi:hypothetical protein